MAQTKRKRRSKHRGNAAGRVEARGRTGRKPDGTEIKPSGRFGGGAAAAADRRNLAPTWKSAAAKSAFASAVLFVFIALDVFNTNTTITAALFMCTLAWVLYTPLTYFLDKTMYQRRQRRQNRG